MSRRCRNACGLMMGLGIVFALGCKRPSPVGSGASGSVRQSTASATVATAFPEGSARAMKKVLQKLEGSWRIESSSGEASDGHVFRVGQRVDVKGDTLSFPAGTTDRGELRKTIRVVLRASGPTAIDLDHRGDFLPTEKPGDDAAARRSPNSKGWSRRAIVRVDGNKMTLALEFPQNARPTDFNPNKATVEVVVLSRIP